MVLKRGDIVFIVLFTLLVGFLGGLYVASLQQQQPTKLNISYVDGEREVVTYLPAVDTQGNGVVGLLRTTIKPGKGSVSVNINVLSYLDTQQSAKIAVDVARNYTSVDTSNLDINYALEVNATAVEGTSAGGAMTVSVIAALQNKTVKRNVMMTGTIEPDSTIGEVGAILEKAKAAKAAGATLFLVPEGQATSFDLKRKRECKKFGFINYCEIVYTQQKVNVSEIAGISVAEVRDIGDAVRLMIES